jgi:hypothetical protein
MGLRRWIHRRNGGTLLWYGDDEGAVLVDHKTGRVAGLFWHDGSGKWELQVCVSFWRAWQVTRRYPASFWTFADFFRCWMMIVRTTSAVGAAEVIQDVAEQSGMRFRKFED